MLAIQESPKTTFNLSLISAANEAQYANQVTHRSLQAPVLEQWQQLVHAMQHSANTRQWVTLINPPFIPNERYLAQIGLANHYLRIVRIDENNSESKRSIQRCLQNGKSSLVALWLNDSQEWDELFADDARLGCKALVFSDQNAHKQPIQAAPQLELLF